MSREEITYFGRRNEGGEMKDKLNNRELFSEEQIGNLVYLLGAEEAIEVIYFPTLEEKERVYEKTFLTRRRKYKE